MLVGMSQEKLGDALGVTFQQVQKYEKGTNRIGASRLHQMSVVLGVPVSFFYEGAAPQSTGTENGFAEAPGAEYVVDFLSTSEGLQLNRAFVRIADPKVRRRIVALVEALVAERE
ncbi:putative HTH-type transcriptional regulator [Chelatococcus reniformis]|uniref:HTH-type transcriptional regulator n=2 Tax=Chelatococcus reniformis TaxID=1494448 RepID=A0A916UXG0_9HYPH|nr:putative HTH-type transcriptional regulator [Chelatococcus reniformis]